MSLGTTSTQAMWGTKKYLIMLYCVFLSLPLSIYVLHVVGMSSKAIYLQATNDCQKQLKKSLKIFEKKFNLNACQIQLLAQWILNIWVYWFMQFEMHNVFFIFYFLLMLHDVLL